LFLLDNLLKLTIDILISLSEIYIAVRGADIIFPYNECHRFSKLSHKTIFNDIQKHLQAIFKLLRPQDKMKMVRYFHLGIIIIIINLLFIIIK